MGTEKPVLKHDEPHGLRSAGSSLWASYATRYVMRPDELRFLEDACRLSDVLSDLRDAAVGADLLTKGSMGQDVLHPLIAEQKTHALAIGTLLARIKLPEAKATPESVSSNARKAAAARWSRGA